MGEVVELPETHNYFMCPDCAGSQWFLIWPREKGDWYIECGGCKSQFTNEILTAAITESRDI